MYIPYDLGSTLAFSSLCALRRSCVDTLRFRVNSNLYSMLLLLFSVCLPYDLGSTPTYVFIETKGTLVCLPYDLGSTPTEVNTSSA